MPKTVLDSGETVTGLVKWCVSGAPYNTNTYFLDENGHFYKRTAGGTWSDLRTVANCHGQGLAVWDDYAYYTGDTFIGFYGPLSGVPAFTDAWWAGLEDTSDTKFAPCIPFKEGIAFLTGGVVNWTTLAGSTASRLVLPKGFEGRTLEVLDEYLVIGAWRGTSILDTEDGYLFFWDGDATTYNFFVKINEGGANAILNTKNKLLSVVGSAGVLNLNYAPFNHVHTIPKLEGGKYLDVFPGAVSNWKGKALIGVSGVHNSATVRQGVYTWANKSDRYPEGLSMPFTISSGAFDSDVKIGMVKGLGDELFISWQDGQSYGVDVVTDTNAPFMEGIYEGLIFDDADPTKGMLALRLKASHLPLAAGESIQLGYKTDRSASYTTGTANSTVGEMETLLPITASVARCRDFQYEVILGNNGKVSTSPTVTGISLQYDDLADEEEF